MGPHAACILWFANQKNKLDSLHTKSGSLAYKALWHCSAMAGVWTNVVYVDVESGLFCQTEVMEP